jgi:hypothetical protein
VNCHNIHTKLCIKNTNNFITIHTTHYIYLYHTLYLLPSVPHIIFINLCPRPTITNQSQGCSFWNVSRIAVSSLLRCAYIKVKKTKNHTFFVECMTLKMKTLQSLDMLATTCWMTQCHTTEHTMLNDSVTQQNTQIFNNLDVKYHTPRISDMCLNSQQHMTLKCFKHYLYTVTLLIIHNSHCFCGTC